MNHPKKLTATEINLMKLSVMKARLEVAIALSEGKPYFSAKFLKKWLFAKE